MKWNLNIKWGLKNFYHVDFVHCIYAQIISHPSELIKVPITHTKNKLELNRWGTLYLTQQKLKATYFAKDLEIKNVFYVKLDNLYSG